MILLPVTAHSTIVQPDWSVNVDVRLGSYWMDNTFEVLSFSNSGDEFSLELNVAIESEGWWQHYSIDWDGIVASVTHIAHGLQRNYSVGQNRVPFILENTDDLLLLKAWGGADHYITLAAPAAVPVPGILVLFSSGLIGLFRYKRDRSKH